MLISYTNNNDTNDNNTIPTEDDDIPGLLERLVIKYPYQMTIFSAYFAILLQWLNQMRDYRGYHRKDVQWSQRKAKPIQWCKDILQLGLKHTRYSRIFIVIYIIITIFRY